MAILIELSYWTINVSLISGLVALLILLYRKYSRYNPIINAILWIVLSMRLLIPASYVTSFSIVNFYKLIGFNITSIQGQQPLYLTNLISQAVEYYPLTFQSSPILTFFQVVSILWIIGVSVILTTYFVSAFGVYRLKKRSKHLGKMNSLNVYESREVTSPFLFGMLIPVVFIPYQLDKNHLDYVILHELAHHKRLDNLKRFFALILCSVHWFNPIVWVCYKHFLIDLEIETDRKVIDWIGNEKKKTYLESIVLLNHSRASFQSNFSSYPLIHRIKTQLDYNLNLGKTIWLIAAVLFVSYFVLLANL